MQNKETKRSYIELRQNQVNYERTSSLRISEYLTGEMNWNAKKKKCRKDTIFIVFIKIC